MLHSCQIEFDEWETNSLRCILSLPHRKTSLDYPGVDPGIWTMFHSVNLENNIATRPGRPGVSDDDYYFPALSLCFSSQSISININLSLVANITRNAWSVCSVHCTASEAAP